jgi:hypothetical protein
VPNTSHLAAPHQYKQTMIDAGFVVSAENNRRDFALTFFEEVRVKTEANGGAPPLGLHTLIGDSTAIQFQNMIKNIVAGQIAPVEIIAHKQ